jgi:hypothetical protein
MKVPSPARRGRDRVGAREKSSFVRAREQGLFQRGWKKDRLGARNEGLPGWGARNERPLPRAAGEGQGGGKVSEEAYATSTAFSG